MHTNIAFLAAVVLLPWGGAQAQSLCDQMAADCADMTGITTRTACYAQVQQCYTELGGEPMPPDAAPPAPPPVPEYVPISPPLEATPEPRLVWALCLRGQKHSPICSMATAGQWGN